MFTAEETVWLWTKTRKIEVVRLPFGRYRIPERVIFTLTE
jgi:hypothetical protein